MTKMFDYDGSSPLEKLKYIDMMQHYLAQQQEELSGNQASTAWLVEQISSHLVDITKAINDLYENQKTLETRLKEIDNEKN